MSNIWGSFEYDSISMSHFGVGILDGVKVAIKVISSSQSTSASFSKFQLEKEAATGEPGFPGISRRCVQPGTALGAEILGI